VENPYTLVNAAIEARNVGDASLAQAYVDEETHLMQGLMDKIDSGRGVGDNSLVDISDRSLHGEGTHNVIKIGNIDSLPQNAKNMLDKYNSSGWKGSVPGQTPGTAAGSKYLNRDRKLPMTDSEGNAITYREFDVNNKLTNAPRDAERFVIGSDGSVYYTNDHYKNFIKIKEEVLIYE
jgi:guanyl-specific ribonuclease Sa